MKACSFDLIGKCDTHDRQNNDDAIKCVMNSLGEDLRQQIQVKRKDNMLFTDIFMMLINIEQPQNAKLFDSHKRKALNVQVSDHPGADIVKMTEFAQSNIIAMICRNAWDSKNNIAPTQLLIKQEEKETMSALTQCFNS